MDFPDPLTPVTHVNVFNGIWTSMSFRLCSLAPLSRIFWPIPFRRGDGTGIASSLRRYFAVSDRGLHEKTRQVARVHDATALLTRTEAQIDDVIGDADHVLVVLDDEHRVALIAKLTEDLDQPLVVARVQPDRRLIENVERAHQR